MTNTATHSIGPKTARANERRAELARAMPSAAGLGRSQILAFASVYDLSAHFSVERDYSEARRHLPVITLFIKDELED